MARTPRHHVSHTLPLPGRIAPSYYDDSDMLVRLIENAQLRSVCHRTLLGISYLLTRRAFSVVSLSLSLGLWPISLA
jgi:hypothetical protein